MSDKMSLEKELADLLNYHSRENQSDTPDFILANYLLGVLQVYEQTICQRDKWFGYDPWKTE